MLVWLKKTPTNPPLSLFRVPVIYFFLYTVQMVDVCMAIQSRKRNAAKC